VVSADIDEHAVRMARGDYQLNQVTPLVAVGSADAFVDGWFDVVVANISGSVVLCILDELRRIMRPEGVLILTGFSIDESRRFKELLVGSRVEALEEWSCVITAHSG
jgi:ribosomal protein L11 methylase PrmA